MKHYRINVILCVFICSAGILLFYLARGLQFLNAIGTPKFKTSNNAKINNLEPEIEALWKEAKLILQLESPLDSFRQLLEKHDAEFAKC